MQHQVCCLREVLATTDGRDKVYRLVQFTAKFVRGPYTELLIKDPERVPLLAQKALTLELVLADGRKLFRLARGLNVLAKYWNHQRTAKGGTLELIFGTPILQLLADLGLFCYFGFDHLVWLYRAGLFLEPPGQKRARFWGRCAGYSLLLSSLASFALYVYQLWSILNRKRRSDEKGAKDSISALAATALEPERPPPGSFETGVLARAVRYGCDILVGLNMAEPGQHSQTLVGAAGVLSSVLQLAQLWPRRRSRITEGTPTAGMDKLGATATVHATAETLPTTGPATETSHAVPNTLNAAAEQQSSESGNHSPKPRHRSRRRGPPRASRPSISS
jgi:hypothetical protein